MKAYLRMGLLLILVLAPASYAAATSCIQPPEGLIAWWPLDETSGPTAMDIVGGNDGTYVNAPTSVIGNIAYALSFDGIDDYVDLGNDSSLDIPGSVTILAWVKYLGVVERSYSYFIADFGEGWVSQLSLGIWRSGENFQFYAYEGRSRYDNTYVYSPADKTEGQWYHVAVVRDDADKTIKLYVNGNVEASNSYAGKVPVSLQGHKYLGSSGPSYTDYFNGDLDEVKIYDRALSDSEIQAIFNGSTDKCTVAIDIKPGVYPNCFNQNERGVIPVAILGSADLDVTQINIESLALQGLAVNMAGKSNKYLAHYDYVDGDNYLDLIVQFQDSDLWIANGNDYATLTGELNDGTPIEGKDSICIVP